MPQSSIIPRKVAQIFLMMTLFGFANPAGAKILWSELGATLAHETGAGKDILGGALKRDDTSSDTLYFKFHVDPLSDVTTEEYFAGFQLYEGNAERLGVGNALRAWAYSVFNTTTQGEFNKVFGDLDLRTARGEATAPGVLLPYELPRHGIENTIVFKVQFVPGGFDKVTVWLNPDLKPGGSEALLPENITTKFEANCSFNEIRIRHGGGGGGWTFSNMAVATSFDDFIVPPFWQTWWFNGLLVIGLLAVVAVSVRVVERKKYQRQLQLADQERALSRERARIAQDLHDELGSSLARISLLSGLAKADKDNAEQVELHVGKIGASADETVRALEEIVWAVRPESDSLSSLVEYIAHFANELFEGDVARCRLDLPDDLPSLPLPPEVRHNIFLVLKEALTNVLRHSEAKEVLVSVRMSGSMMEILIKDDGRGFDMSAPPQAMSNGLENMRRRAETIGGRLTQESSPGKGTTIRLEVKLPERKRN